jgi:ATP-binding cassette subfamily A (ABC1) protein 3
VCEIKGIAPERVNEEIEQTIELVMLQPHRNKKTVELSGGMKRKLSLGMALIGGSKIIILDEPTSGLDVDSRRQVWDLIKQIKQGRSIIMST